MRSSTGQARDVQDGQNSTRGRSRDGAANDWQAKPTGRSPSNPVTTVTPVQKVPEHPPELRRLGGEGHPRHGNSGTGAFHLVSGHELAATLKSWPHRLTAVLSRAIQSSSSTCLPSQPNSTSKPPGVFADGIVLACQSLPVTDEIHITYE
ncbi:hypothetical protein A8926_3341 [Saccharopolyspora spinosa]|uniref:Uncharacterized protein n=1 Tax=Saccharopolyspora spinosa TaxID=60894 RepID=A0A2N3XY67_SACSN|nr:hypothetical protein A8926_3341 [Saccharopolyspora spinosa]